MAVSPSLGPVSIEEFLEQEILAESKHELSRGVVTAMAGASPVHTLVTPVLSLLVGAALRGTPCRYFDQDTKIVVKESNSAFYADGGIACAPVFVHEKAGAIDNPKVIFEVLSPSTEARDRGEKFQQYALLPTLDDYVLIGTTDPRVEVFSRQRDGSWLLRIYIAGATVRIPSVGIDLSVDELYQHATFGSDAGV